MEIRRDDLRDPRVHALLSLHLAFMHQTSPKESVHALDLEALRRPEINFYTAWEGEVLLGCGALLALSPDHGEIKSMRTDPAHLRKGVGAAILQHLIDEARRRGYRRLSLETGTQGYFAPAHQLYLRFGFVPAPAFGDYPADDPNSTFFSLSLPG